MKKKNGFSLVEILAIVVLIGIISGIAIISTRSMLDREEKATGKTLNEKIENATHLYAAKYYADDIVKCDDGTKNTSTFHCLDSKEIKITLKELTEDGLLNLGDDECKSAGSIINDNIYIIYDSRIKYDYKKISNLNLVNGCFTCENDNDCKRK